MAVVMSMVWGGVSSAQCDTVRGRGGPVGNRAGGQAWVPAHSGWPQLPPTLVIMPPLA